MSTRSLPPLVRAALLLASLAAVAYVARGLRFESRPSPGVLVPLLAATVLGLGLLDRLPVGRPGSLRVGERAPTLAFAFVVGLPGWGAVVVVAELFRIVPKLPPPDPKLLPAILGLVGLALVVLRRALGPAAMIPGRAPDADVSRSGQAVTWGGLAACLYLGWRGHVAPSTTLCTVVLAAEALRTLGLRGDRRWLLAALAGAPSFFAESFTPLALVACTTATLGALRRADRRLLTLSLVSALLLGAERDAGLLAATLLVAWTLACTPPPFRRDAATGVALFAVGSALCLLVSRHWPLSVREAILPHAAAADATHLLLLVPVLAGTVARRTAPWSRDDVWWTVTTTVVVLASVWLDAFRAPALCLATLFAGDLLRGERRVSS